MTLSIYSLTVPVFVHMLGNLSAILQKAESYAATKKIEPSVLVNARLAPDMFPLSRQVQIACDLAKYGSARLGGVETPSHPDTESTFAELQERIARTLAFIQSVPEKGFTGSEDRDITIKAGGNDMHFKGLSYLNHFILPNLYFHITVAYAILRHNGLDIGKFDYLGKI